MKKFILLIALIVAGCSSGTKTESKADSTRVDTTAVAAPQPSAVSTAPAKAPDPSTFVMDQKDYDAFIQPGGEIFADTVVDAESVGKKYILLAAKIMSVSTNLYPADADICHKFPWYQVSYGSQSSGWIIGDNILLVKTNTGQFAGTFKHHGKSYTLGIANDASVGPSDQNGLTGCSTSILLYFINAAENTVSFLNFSGKSDSDFVSSYTGWLCLLENASGGVTVTSITSDEEEVRLNVSVSLQEGGYKLVIHAQESQPGVFDVKSVEKSE